MKIGDKFFSKRDSRIYTVAGYQLYTDVVYLQNESKDDDDKGFGLWDRMMRDDDNERFVCEGFSFGYMKVALFDDEDFTEIVDKKDWLFKIKLYISNILKINKHIKL